MHYVLSDIHGDRQAFATILSMIDLQDTDHLYILGDVIDRGHDGIELLQQIRGMKNTTLFLGNHELMMINAMRHPDNRSYTAIWQNNGNEHTYQAFSRLTEDQQENLLQYLESLPVQTDVEVNGQVYVLVHAAPMEAFDYENWRYENPRDFAVWQRHSNFCAPELEGKYIVVGHTITKERNFSFWPLMRIARYKNSNLIFIDCGCGFPEFGGQLGCLRLEDMTEYYSKEGVVTPAESMKWRQQMRKALGWED